MNPTMAKAAIQKLAKKLGADIRDHSPMTNIVGEQQTDGVVLAVVTLADGTQIRGQQCIVTAGPWTNKVLKRSDGDNFKLQPIATFGTCWKCKQELHSQNTFPVFIKYGYPEVYGLPMMDPQDVVKICRYDGPVVRTPDSGARMRLRLRESTCKTTLQRTSRTSTRVHPTKWTTACTA
ncbi:unnamed protein product [Phytophthora fragariaefolia]|uniref:Unnamed protein product n=1 Tax=Phytophthora fragariaefolia TaxID=1490495 RepID=A0A9W7DA71_9STRA|nr:unnamed protein product [Phytophthora fragariaefolia]